MARIEWNKSGERFFETGVDRGVLYPRVGPGVPWNGLTAVNEESSGGDLEPLYYDGVKYMDAVSAEDFGATIEAYSAPLAFAPSDGMKQLAPGMFATNQRRETFGFSYRTLRGNELVGTEYGYKIHIVYNATATPGARNNATIAERPTISTRSWSIVTVPPRANTFKPTAHIVLDSTLIAASKLAAVENVLYGTSSENPRLPSIGDIVSILS